MKLNSTMLRAPLVGAIMLALFAALPARADYQSAVLAQNPAGYWRLNETAMPVSSPTTRTLARCRAPSAPTTTRPHAICQAHSRAVMRSA